MVFIPIIFQSLQNFSFQTFAKPKTVYWDRSPVKPGHSFAKEQNPNRGGQWSVWYGGKDTLKI